MKQSILLLIAIIITCIGYAQGVEGKVSGIVVDANNKPIEMASISVLKVSDTAILKVNATNKEGYFEFANIPIGQYIIIVSAIGYNKAYSNSFEINTINTNIELKTIVLKILSKNLSSVTVTARKPLIEQKIDRTVVNVEAAVSNNGATALEVLEKSPGITVDKDGNISLKGKQGVQIFIDGKPSYISGTELVNFLKSMNANQLDQIEIMTNPPAKYEAAGNAGIINIKTKKNKAKGFNGSVTAGYSQGVYWRTNESLNLNYRNGKYNTFLNYSFNKNNSYQDLTINRTYKNIEGKTSAIFDQFAFMPSTNISNNLKFGMDFFVNNKTTLGFVASGFLNPENQKNYNTAYLKNANGKIDSIVYATSRDKNTWKNGSLNLNFRHQYDSTGKELTGDIDYSTYASQNKQAFLNTSYDPNWVQKGQVNLQSVLPVNINIYAAKFDYTHPINKNVKIEIGVKSSYVNTDNAANYFNIINNSTSVDYDKTNRFQYKENVNAAYLNVNKQFKKIGVQAGLRFENTNYKGHQLGNAQKIERDSLFTKTYTNLFPTIFVSYTANEKNQFALSVGRRIDRPAYQDLNPFLFFLDNYTYQSGNPFLKPQYTNNIELTHTFKSFLTSTINYSNSSNFFTETFEQKEYASIVRQGNIGINQNAGASISMQLPVAKWWSASLYVNYNYSIFKGELYKEKINVSASNVLFNVNNQFQFGQGWSGELSGFYRTRGIEGQIIIQPLGQASAGISKKFLKDKASMRLNIRDLFYTNKAKGSINFQQTTALFKNTRDSRLASLSFTYRFGKPLKGAQNSRKKGGAADEQNRVKAGANN